MTVTVTCEAVYYSTSYCKHLQIQHVRQEGRIPKSSTQALIFLGAWLLDDGHVMGLTRVLGAAEMLIVVALGPHNMHYVGQALNTCDPVHGCWITAMSWD